MQTRLFARQQGPILTQLSVRNFKAFGGDFQAAPMSRITLLYGPNSGGKSSVIQSLLLFKQSEGNLPRAGVLAPQGEYVDLASFKAMVHKHDEDSIIQIELHLNIESIGQMEIELTFQRDQQYSTALPVLTGVGLRLEHHNYPERMDLRLALARAGTSPIDDAATFSWIPEEESSIHSYGQYLYGLLTSSVARYPNLNPRTIRVRYPALLEAIRERGGLTDEMTSVLKRLNFQARSSVLPLTPDIDEHITSPDTGAASEFRDYISMPRSVLEPFSRGFHALLEGTSYLGPILDDPRRFYLSWGGRRSTVGTRGEYTCDIISRDDGVRNKVNTWFERFAIPYHIKDVHNVADTELTGALSALTLEDTRTNTVVTPVDVGFGISQILPVIVEGVASTSRIICVDQPEVHLHPKLQAEIADLLIDCADKQWIVETHSELLVRRILRRIAEGTLDPSSVSVLYVDPSSGPSSGKGSTIKVLEIEQGGNFLARHLGLRDFSKTVTRKC